MSQIIPQVKKCIVCKKGVVNNHHFICDDCCAKRDKLKHKIKMRKLLREGKEAKLRKKENESDPIRTGGSWHIRPVL